MSNEKRRQYRSQPPGNLQVQVRLARGQTVQGKLLDVSGWGAGISFAADQDPGLDPDQRVVVQFSEEKLNLFLGALARICGRQEIDGDARYGFEFTDLRRLHRFLPKELRPYFNRRQTLRTTPRRGTALQVQLAHAGETHAATLFDICAYGIGVKLPSSLSGEFVGGENLALFLQLPGPGGAVLLGGRVVHSEGKGAVGRAGLAFIPRRGQSFARTQRRVHEYSMALQREMLQRKLH